MSFVSPRLAGKRLLFYPACYFATICAFAPLNELTPYLEWLKPGSDFLPTYQILRLALRVILVISIYLHFAKRVCSIEKRSHGAFSADAIYFSILAAIVLLEIRGYVANATRYTDFDWLAMSRIAILPSLFGLAAVAMVTIYWLSGGALAPRPAHSSWRGFLGFTHVLAFVILLLLLLTYISPLLLRVFYSQREGAEAAFPVLLARFYLLRFGICSLAIPLAFYECVRFFGKARTQITHS